jgi:hypothetical protein
MTRVFQQDPVLVEKARVRAALAGWDDARRGVNNAEDIPERLEAIVGAARRITETIGTDIVSVINAVVVELEGIAFDVDPDEAIRG